MPGPVGYRPDESFAFKYVLSAMAAATAETVTFPLDITKTRLQVQGEQASAAAASGADGAAQSKPKPRGMFGTMFGIVREEGILNLYRGLAPAILRHLVYTGVRMGCYEHFREKVFKRDENGRFPLWKAMISGMSAGAIAQFFASPTDLVKVQMQLEGKRRLQGLPPRYTGTWNAFSTIAHSGGIRGLWRGWIPNVQRAALVNLGELTTYDSAKQFILRHTDIGDNMICHTLSSACSGLVAATVGTPADVVKTRVMNQPYTPEGRGQYYSGAVDCLVKTVRQEGFGALYKGFFPNWARMAPWSLTFWLTYEQLRRLTGHSSF